SRGATMNRGSLLATTVMFGSGALYALGVYVPGVKAVAEGHSELNRKLAYIVQAEKTDRATDRLQHDLGQMRDYNQLQTRQLLNPTDLPVLYGQISQIAKSHDLATPKFEPKAPAHYESLQRVSIGLGVTGAFESIYALVQDLEALPARIWIDEMH